MLSAAQRQRISKVICDALPNVYGVSLFGSQITGQIHDESDVDLAILAQEPIDQIVLWTLAQKLAADVGRDLDLLDLRPASTVMQMQVVGKGVRLACLDEFACEVFEDFVFSDYARLNEERANILMDIAERGSVYG